MPKQKTNDTESLRPASANTIASNASGSSPSRARGQATGGDDVGDLPLIWEKVSNKILKHINDRFDKLEQTLQVVQSSQTELMEKVESVEEQVLEQESRISCLEKSLSNLKNENSALRPHIKIMGIPELEERGKTTKFIKALIPKLLGEDNFQAKVIIDRAHRTLLPPPPDGAPRSTFIGRRSSYCNSGGRASWSIKATRCLFSRTTHQM